MSDALDKREELAAKELDQRRPGRSRLTPDSLAAFVAGIPPNAPEPTQYLLIHHAAQLARMLENAGVPEANKRQSDSIVICWYDARVADGELVLRVYDDGYVRAWRRPGDFTSFATFHVTDPLPPALLAAIRGDTDA